MAGSRRIKCDGRQRIHHVLTSTSFCSSQPERFSSSPSRPPQSPSSTFYFKTFLSSFMMFSYAIATTVARYTQGWTQYVFLCGSTMATVQPTEKFNSQVAKHRWGVDHSAGQRPLPCPLVHSCSMPSCCDEITQISDRLLQITGSYVC
jgi:hypothetical protein